MWPVQSSFTFEIIKSEFKGSLSGPVRWFDVSASSGPGSAWACLALKRPQHFPPAWPRSFREAWRLQLQLTCSPSSQKHGGSRTAPVGSMLSCLGVWAVPDAASCLTVKYVQKLKKKCDQSPLYDRMMLGPSSMSKKTVKNLFVLLNANCHENRCFS